MSTPSPVRMAAVLSTEHRGRLMSQAREVNFSENAAIFEEGTRADSFWIVRSGTVTLQIPVHGRRPAPVENLGPGELVGWSWLFPPYVWQLSAEAMTPVRAYEFDGGRVRMLMDADPAFGSAIGHWVGRVLALRLHQTRTRLLDLYAPRASA
ncbi:MULTISPECIES: Crp/Fnr family transcriptional regulator [unclassified Streptomyces]|uniref:Crp/Fnr family transcriptional regulator n=1 Tax=unclassified Streptomyces TaxID=2593676 RepID=UPI00214C879D|nr:MULTISPECIES: cyclic nucleotide-binding domain-containing protein [unclassified Streptomyces]MCX5015702.1 cyclic nucleotide-binding domain-containing protein [Streptomyces sp. NBC_00555]MCX5609658.1 cyclic nucleotide-binding domain-containing protein [Streptomyces sp. NBC_00047]UUU43566.1 cyclic nucleotide-binding domain-containing protein [Streptomyces sp. NBC_00162]